jgi:hypothetical protein
MNTNVNKAVLVSLNMGRWGANKMDREMSQEVATAKNLTDVKLARVWKSLLPKNEAMDTINSVHKKARSFHYKNTFAWSQEGYRILPNRNYMPYMEFMRQAEDDSAKAVTALGELMPDLMLRAKTALNSIFKESDYPSVASILKRYYLKVSVMQIPKPEEFTAEVGDAEATRVRADIEKTVTEAFRAANQDLWDRMFATVNKIQERLSDPKGVREQTLKSLREMLGLLDRLNVSGDERLERLRVQALSKLGGFSAKDLNGAADQKAIIVAEAAQMRDAMSVYMGGTAHGA